MLLSLARKSLRQRRLATGLTVCSIGLSVSLLLGVDLVRLGARDSFTGAVSGTDLVVGSRSSPLQLTLYTVFGIGSGVDGVSSATWEKYSRHPAVEWTAPLSFGDSYRGFRVLGTNNDFFERYRFHGDRQLVFRAGDAPQDSNDSALGSAVAAELGRGLGDALVVAHGVQEHALLEHEDAPFDVVGVLERTNTPLDRTVFITLEGVEAMHEEYVEHRGDDADQERRPASLTAFLVGLESRPDVLRLKREIEEDETEPLTAVMPAVALHELWTTIGYAESALQAISIAVVITSLIGVLISLYSTLQERRREIAVLRAVGLGRGQILLLLTVEAGLLAAAGVVLGIAVVYASLFALQPALEAMIGLHLPIRALGPLHLMWLSAVVLAATALGLLPGWKAYRRSLADGLAVRL
ncbi:MAG: ABC transporter permease [Bryobacterales bacterium]|nr:ABC transporter permease [Bryobacterales bacterium]